MPAVISKLLAKTEQTREYLNIPRDYVTGGIVAGCLLVYALKIGYPIVESYIHKGNAQQDSVNNNLLVTKAVDVPVPAPVGNRRRSVRKLTRLEQILYSIPGINAEYILSFIKLIRIMIPSLFCAESGLLGGHTFFLFVRTFLSIYVANLEGAIVKYIVRKDSKNFIKQLLKWFTIAIPATFINSMIR